MRQVGTSYLQEEARSRGGQPRVKAVLYPFELDYGLASGSGEFVNTQYGGEPGKLTVEEGCATGSWTSPVIQTYAPHLNQVVPSWEEHAGDLKPQVYLRTAESAGEISNFPFLLLFPKAEFTLDPYSQVKVEFGATRAWAVESSGEVDEFTAYAVEQDPDEGYESYLADSWTTSYLSGLGFEGQLSLRESEIFDAGKARVELARDFREVRAADHSLVLDNRQGQWLSESENFYLQGLDWIQKQVTLYHGWELPNGQVEWQLIYQGVLQRLTGMAHGWQERHRATLESQDWVAARLKRLLGAPSPTGERRPFMRGAYLAKGDLVDTTAAQISSPVKSGSGSGTLKILGTYRGTYSQDYLLEIETSGEVGEARFRWSIAQGQSWEKTSLLTGGPESPVELEEGLSVYWESGPGPDLVAGDYWRFTAFTTVYQYQIYGAPFESISRVYLNGEETLDRVTVDAASGMILVSGRSAQVEARVVKDRTTHPVDILTDILTEVGLSQAIYQDSFALAKSVTPDYVIGVSFENRTASQALREILSRCLYDLWVDSGEIKIRAFLGED